MKFKHTSIFALLLLLFVLNLCSGQSLEAVRIGLLSDGPWTRQNAMLESIKREILDLTSGEFIVQFPADKTIEADWSLDGVNAVLNRLLDDPDVDIILTIGSIASHQACQRKQFAKPVIATYTLDAKLQNLPIENGKSGIKNLNYISVPSALKRDMLIFQDIIAFKKLAIPMNQHFLESYPRFTEAATGLLRELNIEAQFIGVGNSAQEAMKQISAKIEAVYILPLPHISDSEYDMLVKELIKRKLPSFTYAGAEQVERGIFAGLYKDVINRIARRAALNVQRILLGDRPEDIPVTISLKHQLTINVATQKAIGVYPSWAVITEAELVGRDQRKSERVLELGQVIKEAIAANLELAANAHYVAAGRQNVNQARSKLLPAFDLSGTYLVIDADRAEGSMGQQAERTLSGAATATQIIYSEPAWANLSIQKKLQKSREFEHEQLKLDIAKDAVTAFLNVLRAKTFERIQQENLRRTRQNLDLANVREVIGSAGPAEVYRWESEIASNRKAVIQANAQRNLAEIQLNRLLQRPAEESFVTKGISLSDPALITSKRDLSKYIDNKQAFKIFRQFMVEEAFKNSPELAALEEIVAVKLRLVHSAANSFWSPTLALQGQIDNVFSRAGKGTEPFAMPQLGFASEKPKDLSWNIGLNLSFPLFKGGEKFSVRQKAIKELEQLRIERKAIAGRIEQRMRSALHIAGASFASITQSRLAAAAAAKSLDVVQDLYSQGLVSIVELLDGQHAALVTEQAASNSVYDFLVDLMEVERALGKFTFFSTEKKLDAFFKRVDGHFEKAGMRIIGNR